MVGLAIGLPFGLVVKDDTGSGIVPGLAMSFFIATCTGLYFGLAARVDLARANSGAPRARTKKRSAWREWAAPNRFAWRVPGRSRWRMALLAGLGGYLWVPLLLMSKVPSLVLVLSLAFGVGMSLQIGFRTTPKDRLALGQDAARIIHDDLMSGLIVGLIWLGVLLTIPVANWVLHGHSASTPQDSRSLLFAALLMGSMLAITSASQSAATSVRYATASLLFRLTGRFPRRPAQFLEWARNSGLLRVTGVAYQFRHDTYQQWLGTGDVEREASTRHLMR